MRVPEWLRSRWTVLIVSYYKLDVYQSYSIHHKNMKSKIGLFSVQLLQKNSFFTKELSSYFFVFLEETLEVLSTYKTLLSLALL